MRRRTFLGLLGLLGCKDELENMNIAKKNWWTGGISSYEYSTEYQAVINYAIANGIDLPPSDVLQEDDVRVRAAVADGSWANEDLVYYMIGRGSYRSYAKINWKNPGTYNLTEVGTLTFDDWGFWGDGSTGYLKTGYVPSTHAVKYTLNNGSVRGFTSSNKASSTYLFGCETSGSTKRLLYIPRNASNVAAYVINGTTSDTGATTNHYGFFHIKRTASNAFALFRDGASIDSSTAASTSLPEFELYILALNTSGTASGFTDRNIGIFLLGASQNTLESANNTIWNPHYVDQSLGFTPDNTYLIYLNGQSNSEGVDPVTSLSATSKRRFNNVYIWFNPAESVSGGRWEKLQVGLNNQRSSRFDLKAFGSEVRIAELFEENHPNDVLYISKYGIGSSYIANTNPTWNAAATGQQLDIAIDNFHVPGKTAIPTSPITDKGLIWVQGEQDATSTAESATATFRTNTADMFSEFRTRVSNANLPIVVCRLNANIVRDATRLGNIRTAQWTTSGNLGDTATYPNNIAFDTDSYPLLDEVHIEQYQFGEDLYNVLF